VTVLGQFETLPHLALLFERFFRKNLRCICRYPLASRLGCVYTTYPEPNAEQRSLLSLASLIVLHIYKYIFVYRIFMCMYVWMYARLYACVLEQSSFDLHFDV